MLGTPKKGQSNVAAAGAADTPQESSPAEQIASDAEQIAHAFTNKYYPLRHDVSSENSLPELTGLYSKDSEFTIMRQQKQDSLKGADAIIEKLKSMNYSACSIQVEHVLAQASVLQSILIAIQGVLKHDGSPFENFSHIFLLAFENGSYFIRNEHLIYSQFSHQEDAAGAAQPVTAPAPVDEAVAPVVVEEPEPVAPVPVEVEPPAPEPVVDEPEVAVVEPEVVAAPKAEKKPSSKKKQERSNQKTKAPKNKPAESNNSTKKEEPQKVEAPMALNWAARIGTKPPPAKPVAEPVQPVAEPAEAKTAKEADKKPVRANGKDAAPEGERNVRAARKQTPPEFDTPKSIEKALYVSNLPDDMQEAAIEPAVKALFQSYGNIIRVLVPNPSKHYCFVHFDSADSKNAALEAAAEKPVVLGGQELGVVARKPLRVRDISDSRRGRSRGGFRGGRGRGTGAGGQSKSGDRRRGGGRSVAKSQGGDRRARTTVKAP